MRKYSLKRTVVALTLASAMTLNLAGCVPSNGDMNSNVESASQGMLDDSYRQEDYFFVYLNNNMYFTTRKLSETEDYFDYFDVKTGELVARMLKPLSDAAEYSNGGIYHEAIYHDEKHFDGAYGYGKVVPKCALVSLNNLMDGSTFTQEEFDFFSSNSEELKKKIQDCISYSSYQVEDSNVVWRSIIVDDEITSHTTETATLRKYDCVTKDGDTCTFIAYQCSYNSKDIGYNYIYDILTGTIHYVGDGLEKEFDSITVSDYDNYENKNVSELVAEFGRDIKEPEEPSIPEKKYHASELFVLDSQSSSVVTASNLTSRYYFLRKTGEKIQDEDFVDEKYVDLYNEEAEVSVSENQLSGLYFVPDIKASQTICYAVIDGVNPLSSFERFLAENGLESFISKDGKYSLEDIAKVKEEVTSIEKAKEYSY